MGYYFKGMHVKKEYTDTENRTIARVSNWVNIHNAYNITEKNRDLGYYITDENGYRQGTEKYDPKNGTYCDYIQYKGRKYPVERFINFGWYGISFEEKDGLHHIGYYDNEDYSSYPLLIEFDECCEKARLFIEL